MEPITLIIALALGYALAFIIHAVIRKPDPGVPREAVDKLESELTRHTTDLALARQELESERKNATQLRDDLAAEREKRSDSEKALSAKSEQIRNLQEDLEQKESSLNELLQRNLAQFQNLAQKLLDENTKKFTTANREKLDELLKPFQERIVDFRKTVEESNKNQDERFIRFENELKHLKDLNREISEEANALTRALKGETKRQGNWGEMILQTILDKSGLTEGEEYVAESSFTAEVDGEQRRVRPDVVVHLPGGRHVVIDSKVSLNAFERYANAEDDAEAEQALKEHVLSVTSHVKGITVKNYQEAKGLHSLDFILVFIPIEAAFNLALQRDTTLYDAAFEKNIVIVTPSTLLATLRVVENLWKQEKQNKNALKIAQQAGRLYDKFVGFLEDMENLDNRLRQARDAFDAAENKLKSGTGNLIKRTETLKSLGARTAKQLPGAYAEIETVDETSEIENTNNAK